MHWAEKHRFRVTTAAWLVAALALARPAHAFAAEMPPHPAVVRVMAAEGNGASFGSGTLVAVDGNYGMVVTNWHVVRDSNGFIVVTFPDGFRSTASVLQVDRDWDLAALAIGRPRVPPVPLAAQPPQPGDWLTIAGYGQGDFRAAAGRCTQYVSVRNLPPEMVEVGTAARQGDSGGPIFNARGELAGVLWGSGWGSTNGAYCGRVRTFLAGSWDLLQRMPGSSTSQRMLAQRGELDRGREVGTPAALGRTGPPTDVPLPADAQWVASPAAALANTGALGQGVRRSDAPPGAALASAESPFALRPAGLDAGAVPGSDTEASRRSNALARVGSAVEADRAFDASANGALVGSPGSGQRSGRNFEPEASGAGESHGSFDDALAASPVTKHAPAERASATSPIAAVGSRSGTSMAERYEQLKSLFALAGLIFVGFQALRFVGWAAE